MYLENNIKQLEKEKSRQKKQIEEMQNENQEKVVFDSRYLIIQINFKLEN